MCSTSNLDTHSMSPGCATTSWHWLHNLDPAVCMWVWEVKQCADILTSKKCYDGQDSSSEIIPNISVWSGAAGSTQFSFYTANVFYSHLHCDATIKTRERWHFVTSRYYNVQSVRCYTVSCHNNIIISIWCPALLCSNQYVLRQPVFLFCSVC